MSKLHSLVREAGAKSLSTKVASGAEGLLKVLGLVADDGITLALRSAMKSSERAVAVPAAVERFHRIEDPNYQPDPTASTVKRVLNIAGKVASAGNMQAARVDQPAIAQLDNTAAASSAFDRLRAYMKPDTAPVNP